MDPGRRRRLPRQHGLAQFALDSVDQTGVPKNNKKLQLRARFSATTANPKPNHFPEGSNGRQHGEGHEK